MDNQLKVFNRYLIPIISDIVITVTYKSDGCYEVALGDKSYSVDGHLDNVGNKTVMECTVDGIPGRANVVQNGDTVHVFSMVSWTELD